MMKRWQTITLIEYLNCGKVNLVGTSGGAWAAINVALGRPDLIYAVIADSFDGRTLNDNFSDNLLSERTRAKKRCAGKTVLRMVQGKDWEKIVDLDTEALLQCAREKRPLFHKSLKDLRVPVLLVGSKRTKCVDLILKMNINKCQRLFLMQKYIYSIKEGTRLYLTNCRRVFTVNSKIFKC